MTYLRTKFYISSSKLKWFISYHQTKI